jgi:hypothetical protein
MSRRPVRKSQAVSRRPVGHWGRWWHPAHGGWRRHRATCLKAGEFLIVQLIGNRSRQRRHLVVRGRVGNPGRRGECGLVRVRPQPRLLLAGRPIECCVRRSRVGSGGQARCRVLACRRQDIRRLWEDRACGRLDGGGCGIQTRRGDRIGTPGFDFDAAVTGAEIESLGPASKKKPRPKKTTTVAVATTPIEMRWSKVPRLGSGVLTPSFGRSEGAPGALADCGPAFREAGCCASSSNTSFPSVRRGISRSPFPGKTSQIPEADGDRKAPVLVIET